MEHAFWCHSPEPYRPIPLKSAKNLRKEITEAVLAQCLRVFHDDCILGKIQQKTIPWTAAFTEAETLSRRVAARQACRFFDLLHVAIAVISDADFFATLDHDQAALAESAGLKAVDLS